MKEKKKYQSGTATKFLTRKFACNKLQLSLADFRQLCILKGIYPHEPHNRKKAGRGSTAYKTFYYKKDIQFLLHEPIISKFRQNKIFLRKLAKAKGREEKGKYEHLRKHFPKFKIDHVVRERYPNFIDAVRDMDDALCMCFLYATMPKMHSVSPPTTRLCRRLSIEFLHYLIASRSIQKAFISIKGYYFQAEIMSQTVTWLIPHNFAHSHFDEVDFRVMASFTKFYTTMLGFVMYRLYQSLNLHYPPKIALLSALNNEVDTHDQEAKIKFCTVTNKMSEVVASLNVPLVQYEDSKEEDDDKDDDDKLLDGELTEDAQEAKKKREENDKFKKLFEGCKFFLSREVPKDQFVFLIKCFGGEVSWDKATGMGSTFSVDDESITHQVVDRPSGDKTYISRYYVQPQWLFDSVNARMLLPLAGYLPGDVLPPHLSPFVTEEDGAYVPPERQRVIALQRGEDPGINNPNEDLSENEEEEEEAEVKGAEMNEEVAAKTKRTEKKQKKSKKIVKPGKTFVDQQLDPINVAAEEKKLAVMMIPKRRRRLYNKITYGIKRKQRESNALALKRKLIDEEVKEQQKRKPKKAKRQTA